MGKPKIAILGSTSHIAKGLIHNFLRSGEFSLDLYSRSGRNIASFIRSLVPAANKDCLIHEGYSEFLKYPYDVIVNCVGVGTLKKPAGNYSAYFTVTEEYDNLVIKYLCENNSDGLYISFSSGALYGRAFTEPAEEWSVNGLQVNHVGPEDYYGIVRINAEAKHRSHRHLRIIDLRIFSYFSRYINLADGYFITDVMEAILNNRVLVTNSADMVRDYLHPEDLFAMVIKCIQAGKINQAMDVNSLCPVTKEEILNYFTSEYGLKYESGLYSQKASTTGAKRNYYSTCNRASQVGYMPQFSSMETIKDEARYILSHKPVA